MCSCYLGALFGVCDGVEVAVASAALDGRPPPAPQAAVVVRVVAVGHYRLREELYWLNKVRT